MVIYCLISKCGSRDQMNDATYNNQIPLLLWFNDWKPFAYFCWPVLSYTLRTRKQTDEEAPTPLVKFWNKKILVVRVVFPPLPAGCFPDEQMLRRTGKPYRLHINSNELVTENFESFRAIDYFITYYSLIAGRKSPPANQNSPSSLQIIDWILL